MLSLPGYDLFLHGVTERGNWLARRTRHLVPDRCGREEAVLAQGHGEDLIDLGVVLDLHSVKTGTGQQLWFDGSTHHTICCRGLALVRPFKLSLWRCGR